MNYKIGIIGAGVMGRILANRLKDVLINDRDKGKLAMVDGVEATQEKLVEKSNVLILAVKPQDFKELASQLKGLILKEKMVISIMAGVSIKTIQDLLDIKYVVRAMPNIPCKIGKGVVVWKASDFLNQEQKQNAEEIFGCLGKTIEVENEQYIDMATAVSGSGPAYVYLFQELLIEATKNLGLPEDIAEELVIETILGAVALQKNSNVSPVVLREQVTSKGGTTEAAIKVFEENNLAEIFQKALKRAYERSRGLKND